MHRNIRLVPVYRWLRLCRDSSLPLEMSYGIHRGIAIQRAIDECACRLSDNDGSRFKQ